MNKALVLLSLSATLLLSQPSLAATIWEDNFDDPAMTEAKWDTNNDTSGLRWCADTAGGSATGTGQWIDVSSIACHGILQPAGYGTITVNNGEATFETTSANSFPFIFKELDEPELDAGNFSIEYRMKYNSVQTHGSGLVIRGMDFPSQLISPNSAPFNDLDTYLYTWGDYQGSRTTIDGGFYPPSNSTEYHIYRLDYVDGVYYYYLDGDLIAGPIVKANRPNMIWLGDPIIPWWYGEGWSSFSVDYIRISDELPPQALCDGSSGDPITCIGDLTAQLSQCKADLTTSNNDLLTCNNSLLDSSAQLEQCSGDLLLADNQILTLSGQVTNLQTSLDQCTADLANASAQIDTIKNQILRLIGAEFDIDTSKPIDQQITDLVAAMTTVNGNDVRTNVNKALKKLP